MVSGLFSEGAGGSGFPGRTGAVWDMVNEGVVSTVSEELHALKLVNIRSKHNTAAEIL
jgi:hypothetical protein